MLPVLAGAPVRAAGLPVELIDPRLDRAVELQAGDAALHVVFFATWCPPCVDELERRQADPAVYSDPDQASEVAREKAAAAARLAANSAATSCALSPVH